MPRKKFEWRVGVLVVAVECGLERFRSYLYGKVVCLYTDHEALEPLYERNRAYRQYSAPLTRWLDRLAYFNTLIKHTAGKTLAFTDHLSRHPTKEVITKEIYDDEYVINFISELFKLNRKYGKLLNTDWKIRPIEQSTILTLKANRESTNEIASPKKLDSDVNPNDFTREQEQANM